MDIQKLKFPIGEFSPLTSYSLEQISTYIEDIESLPSLLRKEVEGLTDAQLETPYRPDGWTIRQVVHHIPDSHMNAFIRFKLTLTEDKPTIKPYYEDRWAELPDAKLPPEISLTLVEAVHKRWSLLLKALDKKDFERSYIHSEYKKVFSLKEALHMYSWHGKHHLAHIKQAKNSF
ncbi:MAG: putative metal-dependent hydrolase [Bacteroidetes bacterium]|nr:putative metal-dependent hydrolase [Bacteroidota bacterium]